MRWRLNPCHGHREKITLLANGLSPEVEQAALHHHLAHCVSCRQYQQEMAGLNGELRRWAEAEPSAEPGIDFRARWMQSIEAADSPTPTSSAALLSRWAEWLWPSPLAWGALAAVWIGLLSLRWTGPAQQPAAREISKRAPSATVVTFAQRQRELTSLLKNL